MREGKERRRLEQAAELAPREAKYQPPDLRRVVVVIDFDIEQKVDVFRMYRTNRIDSYQVQHNTNKVDGVLGWSNFCKRLSGHYPRLMSPYSE